MRKLYFFTVILVVAGSQKMMAQQGLDIALAAGFPEFVNLGLRYQINQTQLGLAGVFIPTGSSGEYIFTISNDYFFHFGKETELSTRKRGYFRTGFSYFREENHIKILNTGSLYFRIGREFNLSDKLGINLDGGLAVLLFNKEMEKQPSWFELDFFDVPPVFPAFGTGLFYKF